MRSARQVKKFLKQNGVSLNAIVRVKGFTHNIAYQNDGQKVFVKECLKDSGFGYKHMTISDLLKEIKALKGLNLAISCHIYPNHITLAVKGSEWVKTGTGEAKGLIGAEVFNQTATIW